jgi:hypothetical protein
MQAGARRDELRNHRNLREDESINVSCIARGTGAMEKSQIISLVMNVLHDMIGVGLFVEVDHHWSDKGKRGILIPGR